MPGKECVPIKRATLAWSRWKVSALQNKKTQCLIEGENRHQSRQINQIFVIMSNKMMTHIK